MLDGMPNHAKCRRLSLRDLSGYVSPQSRRGIEGIQAANGILESHVPDMSVPQVDDGANVGGVA